jgi:hypothetical protein
MKLNHRHTDQRVKHSHWQIDQRVQAARDYAMIRYAYGKRV